MSTKTYATHADYEADWFAMTSSYVTEATRSLFVTTTMRLDGTITCALGFTITVPINGIRTERKLISHDFPRPIDGQQVIVHDFIVKKIKQAVASGRLPRLGSRYADPDTIRAYLAFAAATASARYNHKRGY